MSAIDEFRAACVTEFELKLSAAILELDERLKRVEDGSVKGLHNSSLGPIVGHDFGPDSKPSWAKPDHLVGIGDNLPDGPVHRQQPDHDKGNCPSLDNSPEIVALRAWERFYRSRPIENMLAEHADTKALLLYADAVQRTQWALSERPKFAVNPTREEAVP